MGGSGPCPVTVAALATSSIAAGAGIALLALSGSARAPPSARRRSVDEEEEPVVAVASSRRRGQTLQSAAEFAAVADDVTSGMSMGFSMAQAREFADSGHEAAKNRSPEEVLAELQKGNTRFWMGHSTSSTSGTSAFARRALISKQFPSVAILACSDSRVPPEMVFDQGLGDMFVIRVAGNCLDTTTMASLQYAVNHLKVKVVMVMGHEACGAVKAAQLPVSAIAQEPEALSGLLHGLRRGLCLERIAKARDARALDREAVVTNVKRQVEKLTAEASVMEKVTKGDVMIVGAFYEISSGIVDFFHEVSETSQAASDLSPVAATRPAPPRQPTRGVLSRLNEATELEAAASVS